VALKFFLRSSKFFLMVLLLIHVRSLAFANTQLIQFKFFPKGFSIGEEYREFPLGITAAMISELNEIALNKEIWVFNVFVFDGRFVATYECYLDVLEWKEERWVNLYNSENRGFNCGAIFFINNGLLYSFGRYGYWRGHSELLVFDWIKGSWEVDRVHDLPDYYQPNLVFVDHNSIYSFFGFKRLQSANFSEIFEGGYLFDFNSKKWSILDLAQELKVSLDINPSHNFQNSEISFYESHTYPEGIFIIYDKLTNSLFIKPHGFFNVNVLRFYWLVDDKMHFIDQEGKEVVLDREFFLNKAIKIGEASFQVKENRDYYDGYAIQFAIVIMLVVGGFILVWKLTPLGKFRLFKSQTLLKELEVYAENFSPDLSDSETQRLIESLESYRGQKLNSDLLDEIFNINQIENPDYKRVKRSRTIIEINQKALKVHGKILIHRERDKFDRRMVLYFISE
jgi:hypothetical protein